MWPVWRVIMSKRFNATYPEITQQWSIKTLRAALELIDVFEEAEAIANADAVRG